MSVAALCAVDANPATALDTIKSTFRVLFFGVEISYRLVYQDERYELASINSLGLGRDVL